MVPRVRLVQLPGGHAVGCTAVSWAPAYAPGALISGKAPTTLVKRLVTAGCDNVLRVSGQSDARGFGVL